MAESALSELALRLRRCEECLRAVHLCICEDRPDDGHRDHKLLQDIEDAVGDAVGEIDQAGTAATAALNAARRGDAVVPARAVEQANRLMIGADRRLRDDITGRYLPQVRRLVRDWGPDWTPWAGVVGTGLGEARDALDAVVDAMVSAWAAVSTSGGGLPHPNAPATRRRPR